MALLSLDTEEIIKIEALIRRFNTALTWQSLVERIESDLDIKTTRQTLPKYPSIKAAYDAKKQELRGKPSPRFVKFIKSDQVKFEQIEKLKAENLVLHQRLAKQLDFIEELSDIAKNNPLLANLLNKTKQSIARGR